MQTPSRRRSRRLSPSRHGDHGAAARDHAGHAADRRDAAPSRPRQRRPSRAPEPTPLPGAGLPRQVLGYQDWLRLNEDPIPPIEDGDAHLGTKDVYATPRADRSGGAIVYPDGTIIVKEATRPDTDFIGLVAVMRKEAGADPDHGDWVFVEYTRDGPTPVRRASARRRLLELPRRRAADGLGLGAHDRRGALTRCGRLPCRQPRGGSRSAPM